MKKVFSKIASVTLAFIVLFSTFSFTIEKHLCGGEVADYSFVGNLERCQMPIKTSIKDNSETKLNKIPCCDDLIDIIEGTNSELKVSKDFNLQNIQIATAFVYSCINLFEGLEQNVIPFKDYFPPLVTKDLPVLYDTYLI